jgi:membrane-associated phospholipid phosphatase
MSALTARAPVPDDRSWVRSTWPIDRTQTLRLAVALVAMIGILAVLGLVITDLAAPNAVTRADDASTQWFVDRRTPLLDDLSTWGAFLADTLTKIVITAVFVGAALAVWRRWHEAVFVAGTLMFEATVFIVVTLLVARPRPDVPQLQDSPVDSSFPSGHVAAATVYGAFVIVVFWHTTSKLWRSLALLIAVSVVAAVAWARLYQGMHHVSDVASGIVLGLSTLAVCGYVMGAPQERPEHDAPERAPADDRSPPQETAVGTWL